MKTKLFNLATTMALALTTLCSTPAMAQEKKEQKIDWMKELTERITFNGYAQGGYSYNDAGDKTTTDFNLKRTLLWAKARITDRWSFLFMYDFSSVVQEFYTDFRVTDDDMVTVRVGQFKHSYSMENPLSPTQLELVDVYSQAVLYLAGEGPDPLNGVNYGRDMGLMVYGNLLDNRLHYELAIMNGQGINRRDGNSDKDYIAKVEYKPEMVPGLRVVASGQIGRGHAVGKAAWNPEINVGDNYRRDRYSIGAEYKYGKFAPGKYKEARPISVRAEWLGGKDGNIGSNGGYITTAVPLTDGIDAVASLETFNRNTTKSGWRQSNLTIGAQYWFYKKCRVQLQYTRCFCGDYISNDYNWLQGQIQVAF